MTVQKLREWLAKFDDQTEVMVETWDEKSKEASGLKPLVLCIDCEMMDHNIVLYGKKVR